MRYSKRMIPLHRKSSTRSGLLLYPADGCLHASGAQKFGVCAPRSSQFDQSAYVLQDVDTTALISNLWSALSRSPALEPNQQQSSADALVVFVGNQVHILLQN